MIKQAETYFQVVLPQSVQRQQKSLQAQIWEEIAGLQVAYTLHMMPILMEKVHHIRVARPSHSQS